jgi:Ca2+-binding EF-hand superfamily protein
MRMITTSLKLELILSACFALLAAESDGQVPASADRLPVPKQTSPKAGNDSEQRRADFRQRDENNDGHLTLSEHLGDRQGAARVAEHDMFFRADVDGNELLSLDEFVNRDANGPPSSTHGKFRQHDLDGDGQLTEEEFMRTRSTWKAAKSIRQNFHVFDMNRDGRLDEREFSMLPSNNPDAATLLHFFDSNQDGELTLDEHLRNQVGEARLAARDAFFHFDTDENERLTLKEYLHRDLTQPLGTLGAFRQLDLDDDHQLTEDEFMRLKIGKDWERASRQIFHRFDANQDQRLNKSEFAMTPAQKPTPDTLFAGLDIDKSGLLTRDEVLATSSEKGRRKAHRDFYVRDRDGDGRLCLQEFALESKSRVRITDVFTFLDDDANGMITTSEFCIALPPETNEESANNNYQIALMKAEERFLVADSNGDKQLTREELQDFGTHLALSTEVGNEDNTAEIAPVMSAAQGRIAVKKRDSFFLVMLLAEGFIAMAIILWWIARPQAGKLTQRTAN